MKKILIQIGFWVSFFCGHICSIQATPKLKSPKLDLYYDSNAYGGKLTIPFSEFRLYLSSNKEDVNFSAFYNLEQFFPTLPWQLKVGNLTPSSLYSKLKSPLFPTSLSPFSTCPSEAASFSVMLPSHTSFKQPESLFLQTGFQSKTFFLRQALFNYWCTSTDLSLSVISAKLKLVPLKTLEICASGCAGYFPYQRFNSTSWFYTDKYYHEGNHLCIDSQFSVSVPGFNTLFTGCFYESPFGYFESVYKLESMLKTKRFIFNTGFLYCPQKLITADETKIQPVFQTKGGLQYRFVTGKTFPVFIKTGINTYSKINLMEEKSSVKIAAGLQLSSILTSLTFITTVNTSVSITDAGTSQFTFENGGFQLKNVWYFEKITPGLSGTLSFNPSGDFTSLTTNAGVQISLAFLKNPHFVWATKMEGSKKNWEKFPLSFSSSLKCSTKIKQVSATFKFDFQTQL